MKQGSIVLLLLFAAVGFAQNGRLYPGAKLDEHETSEAHAAVSHEPGVDRTVYFTKDSFDKVYAYFKKNAKEFKVIGARARKLPTGQELHDAFFILDDADSLITSKRWVQVQRPYIGQYGLPKTGATKDDVRDITAVMLTTSK